MTTTLDRTEVAPKWALAVGDPVFVRHGMHEGGVGRIAVTPRSSGYTEVRLLSDDGDTVVVEVGVEQLLDLKRAQGEGEALVEGLKVHP